MCVRTNKVIILKVRKGMYRINEKHLFGEPKDLREKSVISKLVFFSEN